MERTGKELAVAPVAKFEVASTMRADVVKAPNPSVRPADQDDLVSEGRNILHDEIAGPGDLVSTRQVEPGARENRLALFLKPRRVAIDVGGDRLGG